MTDKITLTNLVNLQNETTAVNAINANNGTLTTALNNTLSRDGTPPNQMSSAIDMNSNRVLNLPTAISTTEPVTLGQMTSALVAGGNITIGTTSVPVSAAMQPVVNASTTALAKSLMGVNFPTVNVSTNQTVTSTFNWNQYLATGPITFFLPVSSTLFNGFGFWIYAYGNIVTLTPAGIDKIQRGVSGASVTIPANGYCFVTTDAAGNWAVQLQSGSSTGGASTIYNVRSYGAVGDGVNDDTSAIQAAVNAAQVKGGVVYAPVGSYKVTAPINITSAVNIRGDGYQHDYIIPNFATTGYKMTEFVAYNTTVFNIVTDHSVFFEMFGIVYPTPPSPTTTPAISITGGTEAIYHTNKESRFRDVYIYNAGICINVINAIAFTFDHLHLEGYSHTGLLLQNILIPGSGDSNITNCLLGSQPTVAHIRIRSGGGIRICNNKINGGSVGIYINPDQSTQSISPIFICNNSMESQTINVLFQKPLGVAEACGNVVITGNEMLSLQNSVQSQADPSAPTVPWVGGAIISSNFFFLASTTGAIISLSGVKDALVASNQFNGYAGGTGTSVDNTTCTNVTIGVNGKGAGIL